MGKMIGSSLMYFRQHTSTILDVQPRKDGEQFTWPPWHNGAFFLAKTVLMGSTAKLYAGITFSARCHAA